MNQCIRKKHIIYFLSSFFYIFSWPGASKKRPPKQIEPLQFSKASYQFKLTKHPFSISLIDPHQNTFLLKNLALVDHKNQELPLNYIMRKKNNKDNSRYLSPGEIKDLTKKTYSFVISSHAKRNLQYKLSLVAKEDGIKLNLSPMNSFSKNYSQGKRLILKAEGKDFFKKNLLGLLGRSDHQKANQDITFDISDFFKIIANKDSFKLQRGKSNTMNIHSKNNQLLFKIQLKNQRLFSQK